MTLFAKMRRRKAGDVLMSCEALGLLAFFRVCLAVVPVRRIIRGITRGRVEASAGAVDERAWSTARRVRWAVEAVTRNSAVRFVCFPQTLVGYTMLRRRGVASTMVYGVARAPEGGLIAHTWLMVGDWAVLGGAGSEGFAVVERWG